MTLHVRLAAGQYALQCLFEEQAPVTGPARPSPATRRGARRRTDPAGRADPRHARLHRLGPLPAAPPRAADQVAVPSRRRGQPRQRQAVVAGRARGLRAARCGVRRVRRPRRRDQRAAQRPAPRDPRPRLHRLPPRRARALAPGVDQPGRAATPGRRARRRRRRPARRARERPARPAHLLDPRPRDRGEPAAARAHRPGRLRQPQRPGHGGRGARRHPHRARPGPQAAAGPLPARQEAVPRGREGPPPDGQAGAADPSAHRAIADWPLAQRQRVDSVVAELSERLAPVASVLEPRRVT